MDQSKPQHTRSVQNTTNVNQNTCSIEADYPYNLFEHTSQSFWNPIKRDTLHMPNVPTTWNKIICLQHNQKDKKPNQSSTKTQIL